jgi:queuine/archaeosine tRNA-ribosyltransferase
LRRKPVGRLRSRQLRLDHVSVDDRFAVRVQLGVDRFGAVNLLIRARGGAAGTAGGGVNLTRRIHGRRMRLWREGSRWAQHRGRQDLGAQVAARR